MPRTKEPDLATRQGKRAIDMIRETYMGEKKCIRVPEWGDLDLWFGPITPSAMEKVDDRDPKNNLDRQLLLLISMATDEGGKPLFQFGDAKYLKDTTEFTVLQRVFDFMLSSWLDKDEAEKKIKEDPTSAGDSNSQSD